VTAQEEQPAKVDVTLPEREDRVKIAKEEEPQLFKGGSCLFLVLTP
jgi:hypothetical protein